MPIDVVIVEEKSPITVEVSSPVVIESLVNSTTVVEVENTPTEINILTSPTVIEVGSVGIPGPAGETGAQGPIGPSGQPGPQGIAGIPGVDGYTPIFGVDYFNGEQGPIGPSGIQGIQGEQGLTGPSGLQGVPGPNEISLTTITTLSGILMGNGATVVEAISDIDYQSPLGFIPAISGHPHSQYLLESGYTAADILAKLLTVDGAGSLLDADLLDGLHATAFQAVDATLTSISALGTAADKMIYTTGVDTWAESAITAAGRALLDDADADTMRTTLGLVAGGAGDIWVEKAGDTMTGQLFVDGSANVIQQRIQAHSTQTANIATYETSTGIITAGVNSSGKLFSSGNFPATNLYFGTAGAGSGGYNMGMGDSAISRLTTGSFLVAIGAQVGSSWNNDNQIVAIGYYAAERQKADNKYNVHIGYQSGRGAAYYVTNTTYIVSIGHNTLSLMASNMVGDTAIGGQALYNATGNYQTALGAYAGYLATSAANSIYIGAYAGYRQTTLSNTLIIDNQQRADAATELSNAILYGVMASTPASQTLRINAVTSIYGGMIGNEDGGTVEDFRWETDHYDGIFLDASNDSIVIMSNAAGKVGFFGAAAVVQQTELTDELTTITCSAPGTPDYAIQDLAAGGYGFVTADEGQTALSVIANLQTRVNELETKLAAYGLLVDAD